MGHRLIPHIPPLWREGLVGIEAAGLARSGVFTDLSLPRGGGRAALLVPGFMAGDGSLAVMTRWLRSLGYVTKRTGIRRNVDCSDRLCEALEARLECLAEKTGDRVAIVGQSRGGVIAKVLAHQRPDLVSGIVTLGSPLRSQLAIHPLVLAQVGLVGTLGTARLPGFFSLSCLRGECCSRFREALEGEFPSEVRYVSVYSRRDGVVNWRSCLDRAADSHVEINSSHCGMAVNAEAFRAVAHALGSFAAVPDGGIDWRQAA